MRRALTWGIIVLAFIAGGWLASRKQENSLLPAGTAPQFSFYTSPGATTPQIPLFYAVQQGVLRGKMEIGIETWNDVESLKSFMLSGKGDLWLGHLESFAYARRRGAPVAVLLVSAWRKNFLLSTDASIKDMSSLKGQKVGFAPKGSSAVSVLKAVLGDAAREVDLQPAEINQLVSDLTRKAYSCAVAPEPLVTLLLHKVEGLRVVQSLEDEYSRLFLDGRPVPLAGIAVNTATASRYPDEMAVLQKALLDAGARLAGDPVQGLKALPSGFLDKLPPGIAEESLARDVVKTAPPCDVRDDIVTYMGTVDESLSAVVDGSPPLGRCLRSGDLQLLL